VRVKPGQGFRASVLRVGRCSARMAAAVGDRGNVLDHRTGHPFRVIIWGANDFRAGLTESPLPHSLACVAMPGGSHDTTAFW
jgi:hypothetical protein